MRKTGDTGAHKSRGGQKEMSCNEKREGESKKKEKAASVACFWRLLTIVYCLCDDARNVFQKHQLVKGYQSRKFRGGH